MQVNQTSAEGLKREFTIVVPASDIEEKMSGRLTELGRQVTIPGFRPGKVPMPLLKKRFGEAVRGEVLEKTIQDATVKAITDNNIRPAMEPKIEIVTADAGADLEYKVAVEILPDIVQPDFSKVSLERPTVKVADKDVDEALGKISESRRQFTPISEDRPSATGDQVKIDFIGRIGGEEFDGGAANDFELELGSGRFIPGFEDQLIGVGAGAKKDVTVSFPDDYPAEHLKGKEAVFEVTLKEIQTAEAATLDDAFAKSLGMDDLAALRDMIRKELEGQYVQAARGIVKRRLLDKLSESEKFEVPEGMVEQEFHSIWHQIEHAKEKGELDEDDKSKTDEELKERYRTIAERRVRLGLLLSEIGRSASISVSQDDLGKALAQQARQFPGQEAQVYEFYQKNPQAMQELQAPILEEKVVDYILELADVTDKEMSVEDLMNAEKALEAADNG